MGAVNYSDLNLQRTTVIQEQFQLKLRSRGTGNARPDTLRYHILSAVVAANYNRAREDLNNYLESKSEFPSFKRRCNRYVEYCIDLLRAIERKRDFPGLSSLPLAKQHEILEKVVDHYDELIHYLKRIEAVNAEIQINDLRSTVIVIKTASYAVGCLVILSFVRELIGSIYGTYDMMLTDVAKDFAAWLLNMVF